MDQNLSESELNAIIDDLVNKKRILNLRQLESKTRNEEHKIRNETKRKLIEEMKASLITPSQLQAIETLETTTAGLRGRICQLSETVQSFPFKEVEVYRDLLRTNEEKKMDRDHKDLEDKFEKLTAGYKSLEIYQTLEAKRKLKAVKMAELAKADQKLAELAAKKKFVDSDYKQKMTERIIKFAVVVPELNEIQRKIKEVKARTDEKNSSIKAMDQQMNKLNLERLELEREIYVAKNKSSRPAKIEKKDFVVLQPASSSILAKKENLFIPYVETPAKTNIQSRSSEIRSILKVNEVKATEIVPESLKPHTFVPFIESRPEKIPAPTKFSEVQSTLTMNEIVPESLKPDRDSVSSISHQSKFVPFVESRPEKNSAPIKFSEIRSSLKMNEIVPKSLTPALPHKNQKKTVSFFEKQSKTPAPINDSPKPMENEIKPTGMKREAPVPKLTNDFLKKIKKFDMNSVKQVPEPEKLNKPAENVPSIFLTKNNEKIQILDVVIIKPADAPSTSRALPDKLPSYEFVRPSVPAVNTVKTSPVPIQKINHLILMPIAPKPVQESEPIVVSSNSDSMENDDNVKSVKSVDLESIDLENLENMDIDLNNLENWELGSNFSSDPQTEPSEVVPKTTIATDERKEKPAEGDFFGTASKAENFDFFDF